MSRQCPIKKIIKRDGATVKYNRRRISDAILKASASTGKPNRKLAESAALKVESALAHTYCPDSMPTVEDIQDVVESILMESGLTRIARNYIIYRHRRAMARAARAYEFEVTDNVPYKIIYEVLRWNMEHNCDTTAGLNRLITKGAFPDLVRESDRRYQSEIESAGRMILDSHSPPRLVIVAGPSSSGKTTTTIRLSNMLKAAGIGIRTLNLDNYFLDLYKHPKDEFGDYDYEIPEALDLDLINRQLQSLLAGKTVKVPDYNFKTGRRSLNVHTLRLKTNEVLLIDSLHGLNGKISRSVPEDNKFRLYIETLGQFRAEDGTFMRWSDNRLLRRMIRDKDHRNLKPVQTLTHWHYVRRSELKHIIPFIKHSDFIVNSALPYELPILRHRLLRYVSRASRQYADDPKRLDAYIRANRVRDLLRSLKPVKDTSCIPGDSLLREFTGGSTYKY
ncbi:MAG: ATP cone domain-containing protein [Kiritimatiellia bacterium]